MIIKFNKFLKINEAWDEPDDQDDDYDYDDYDYGDDQDDDEYYPSYSMITMINWDKLKNLGLIEYKDIATKSFDWFEKQISIENYSEVIPPLDVIRDHIIGQIGLDYKQYIDYENLDNLSRFIYQEIDNYVFD